MDNCRRIRGKRMNDLHPDMNRVLLSPEEIQQRVKELAEQITDEMKEIERLYIIGILKGAFIFMADLTRQLKVPHIVDFMAVSSYGKTVNSGAVRIVMDLREPIEGQHVLIVEDILDSGRTLRYLYQTLKGRKPASLRTCVLLRKIKPDVNVPVDYLGFDIGDYWVVGYGLDFADKYRTLPYIAELKIEATKLNSK
jgi:hypoxanthine phosphoribosyltransferase